MPRGILPPAQTRTRFSRASGTKFSFFETATPRPRSPTGWPDEGIAFCNGESILHGNSAPRGRRGRGRKALGRKVSGRRSGGTARKLPPFQVELPSG